MMGPADAGPVTPSGTIGGFGATVVYRLLSAKAERLPARLMCWSGAALLVVSGVIHFHLWDIAYRHVPTLGPLFIVQGVSACLIALCLAIFRRAVLILAALGLVLGTIAGFALVLTVGLFNFKLGFISTEAAVSLAAESAAVFVLLGAAIATLTQTRSTQRGDLPANA